MTDEQHGSPRPTPIDGPTVMGPSAGRLHGPASETPANPPSAPGENAPEDDVTGDVTADVTGPAPSPEWARTRDC